MLFYQHYNPLGIISPCLAFAAQVNAYGKLCVLDVTDSLVSSPKSGTDFLLNGFIRHLEEGISLPSLEATLRVRDREQNYIAFPKGTLNWTRNKWWDAPEIIHDTQGGRISSLPFTYDLAFGGQDEDAFYPANPTGKGWVEPKLLEEKALSIEAPQILYQHEAEQLQNWSPDMKFSVAGVAEVPPTWQPRLGYTGTFDKDWEASRWPAYPKDFDWRFWQSAHPEWQFMDRLKPGDDIEITGMSATSNVVKAKVPNARIQAEVYLKGGGTKIQPLNLDTLTLDATSPDHRDWSFTMVWQAWLGEVAFSDIARVVSLSNVEALHGK